MEVAKVVGKEVGKVAVVMAVASAVAKEVVVAKAAAVKVVATVVAEGVAVVMAVAKVAVGKVVEGMEEAQVMAVDLEGPTVEVAKVAVVGKAVETEVASEMVATEVVRVAEREAETAEKAAGGGRAVRVGMVVEAKVVETVGTGVERD